MSLILLWNYKNLKINHNLKLPLPQTRVKLLEGRDGTWRSEVALFLGKKFDWAGSHLTFYKTSSGSSWNKKITPKPLRLIPEIWPVSKHISLFRMHKTYPAGEKKEDYSINSAPQDDCQFWGSLLHLWVAIISFMLLMQGPGVRLPSKTEWRK